MGAERNNHDWKLYELKLGIAGHRKGLSSFNRVSQVAQWYVPYHWLCLFQSCPTLSEPMDGSPPGSSVHAISQQEYSSGLLSPFSGDVSDPGIEPMSPTLAGIYHWATWETLLKEDRPFLCPAIPSFSSYSFQS